MDLATYKEVAPKFRELRTLLWGPFEGRLRIGAGTEGEREPANDEEFETEVIRRCQAVIENGQRLLSWLEEHGCDFHDATVTEMELYEDHLKEMVNDRAKAGDRDMQRAFKFVYVILSRIADCQLAITDELLEV